MKPAALLVVLTACTQHLYSPPTQAYALAPVHALPGGSRALDLEGSSHSQIFDPAFEAGSARLRTGLGEDAELSVEGMLGAVADGGPSTADRHVYAGRTAARFNPGHGAISFTTGLGGGYAPAGGSFAALDGGISIGYDNCTLVPIGSVSGFVSQPLSARPVDVTIPDDRSSVYATARRTVGNVVRGGLRLSLSPSACRAGHQVPWLTAGLDVTTLVDATSHAELVGLGVGIELPL